MRKVLLALAIAVASSFANDYSGVVIKADKWSKCTARFNDDDGRGCKTYDRSPQAVIQITPDEIQIQDHPALSIKHIRIIGAMEHPQKSAKHRMTTYNIMYKDGIDHAGVAILDYWQGTLIINTITNAVWIYHFDPEKQSNTFN